MWRLTINPRPNERRIYWYASARPPLSLTRLAARCCRICLRKGSEPHRRPIRREPVGLAAEGGEAYTEEELAQVEKHLRDLGYLG